MSVYVKLVEFCLRPLQSILKFIHKEPQTGGLVNGLSIEIWLWHVDVLFLSQSISISLCFDAFLVSNESLECQLCVAIIKCSNKQRFQVAMVQWKWQHFSTKNWLKFYWKFIIYIFIHNSKTIWGTENFRLSLERQKCA